MSEADNIAAWEEQAERLRRLIAAKRAESFDNDDPLRGEDEMELRTAEAQLEAIETMLRDHQG